MTEWSQGVSEIGAVILKDGQPISIDRLLHILNSHEESDALWLKAAKEARDGNWWLLDEFIKIEEKEG